jgi:hypothetical protein
VVVEPSERFRAIADGSYRNVPLYRRLALALADRSALSNFTATLPDHALAGGLLFSALHYLVLSEVHSEFTSAWRREEAAPASVPDLESAFEQFVLQHAPTIYELLGRHRGAQTNEVNRCSYLLPALATVAAERHRPLALLEVGSSAGLLLNFDRYSYRYDDVAFGPPSPVSVTAELRGSLPPTDVPSVGWRLGVDREPIDVFDEDESRWLLANVYPGDTDRLARTSAALAVARQHPPRVVVGEASDLQNLALSAPPGLALTVLTTALLMYLEPASRIDFRRSVERLGGDRPVDWLMCEPAAVLESLGSDVGVLVSGFHGGAKFVGPVVHIASDEPRPQLLASTGPHGRWISWLVHGSPAPGRRVGAGDH